MSYEQEQTIRHSMRIGVSGERRLPGLDEFTVTKTVHREEISDYDTIRQLFAEDDGDS